MNAFTVALGIVLAGLLPYLPVKTLLQALLYWRPRLHWIAQAGNRARRPKTGQRGRG